MKIEQVIAGIVESIDTISIDDIKAQLHPFMMGMTSKAVMFNPGGFILSSAETRRLSG